jgi:hypothetical protein
MQTEVITGGGLPIGKLVETFNTIMKDDAK